MIKVYNPKITVDCFADWFGFTNNSFQQSTDIQEVLSQEIKIACVPAFYNLHTNTFNHELFDLILLSEIENWDIRQLRQWTQEQGIKNYLIAAGSIETPVDGDNEIYRPWWCFNLVQKNKFQCSDIEPLYDFDVLLGARKCHRDFIMANFQANNLLEKSIVNYRNVFRGDYRAIAAVDEQTKKILDGKELLYPYVSPNLDPQWEVRPEITYNVSDIVPWQIFNRTKYSVISETICQYSFFFTEKTTKALFAKRLFIVFAPQGYLKNLHKLGFRTFDNVIDESYDLEEDPVRRFSKAFEQIKYLGSQNYNDVKKNIENIVEHNFNHLYSLEHKIKDTMQKMVYNKIEEIKHANSI